MKKFFALILFVSLFTAARAADYKFPGFSCVDKGKIAEALSRADTTSRRATMLILQQLADRQTPVTFAELCRIIDDVTAQFEYSSDATRNNYRVLFKKQVALLREQCTDLRKDAIAFCNQNPSAFDVYYFIHIKDLFTPVQRYAGIKQCLMKYDYKPADTLCMFEQLVGIGIDLEGIDIKGDLSKLNRRFSLRLVRDKTAWTPVVQSVRTAISAF